MKEELEISIRKGSYGMLLSIQLAMEGWYKCGIIMGILIGPLSILDVVKYMVRDGESICLRYDNWHPSGPLLKV